MKLVEYKRGKGWKIREHAFTTEFYKTGKDIVLNELVVKPGGLGLFSSDPTPVLYGGAGWTINDVSVDCSYIKFKENVFEVYLRDTDASSEEEVRFNEHIIYSSYASISHDLEEKKEYSRPFIKWANKLLKYTRLPKGGASFQDLSHNYLGVHVGIVHHLFRR